jgi:hypothetical protein
LRTTDDILADLQKRADDGEDVRQQVIATQTLARLRAERADAIKAKDNATVRLLDEKIRYWLTAVVEDVDERVASQPGKDSTKLVEETGPVIVDTPSGPVKP